MLRVRGLSWRRNTVTVAPTAVIVSPGSIVAADVTHSNGAVIAPGSHKTAGDDCERREPDDIYLPRWKFDIHFGSTLLSVSDHSINPIGAPIGSAMTAIFPP